MGLRGRKPGMKDVDRHKQHANMIKLYLRGNVSASKIARKYGLTPQAVSYVLRKHGFKMPLGCASKYMEKIQ